MLSYLFHLTQPRFEAMVDTLEQYLTRRYNSDLGALWGNYARTIYRRARQTLQEISRNALLRESNDWLLDLIPDPPQVKRHDPNALDLRQSDGSMTRDSESPGAAYSGIPSIGDVMSFDDGTASLVEVDPTN